MVENFDEQIYNLIYDNCKYLDMQVPAVKFTFSEQKGILAATSYDEKNDTYILTLDRNVNDIRDAYFFVFHELRHIWQISKHKDIFFKNYAQYEEVGSRNYYAQFAEIDVNAYSLAMMKAYFNLVPKVSALPKEALDIVEVRKKKLLKEWAYAHQHNV